MRRSLMSGLLFIASVAAGCGGEVEPEPTTTAPAATAPGQTAADKDAVKSSQECQKQMGGDGSGCNPPPTGTGHEQTIVQLPR
jgi:hypothetical protein